MTSEVIDLNSEDTGCEEVGDFPLQLRYAVGGLLGDHPVVCGGFDLGTNIASNKCYKLDETKQYTEFATMQKPRYHAGIIPHEKGLWITGGENDYAPRTTTTEFILASGNSTRGPDLPSGLMKHAMSKLNSSTSMIIEGNSYETWYFDHNTELFSEGPRLLEKRSGHTAGLIKDSVYTEEQRILVAGGRPGPDLPSVEWLVSGTWEQGNSNHVNTSQNILPKILAKGQLISKQDCRAITSPKK